jgi:hypothetical protein
MGTAWRPRPSCWSPVFISFVSYRFLSFFVCKGLKRGGEDREDGGQPGSHGRPVSHHFPLRPLVPFLNGSIVCKGLKRGGEDREDGGQPGSHGRPP